MRHAGVLGIFDDFDSFIRALKELKGMEPDRIVTYTPIPCHEVAEALDLRPSPMRYFTLAGGLLGFAAGAALTIYCPLAYPLVVGGKPLISVPPYLIIAFELTILFATIVSAIGFFVLSPFREPGAARAYDPGFSEDRFGVLVASRRLGASRLEDVLNRHGAVQTRIQ
ncbi:MAG: DUF3341 domain-containing protein [Acidobacteriota bacterium]